MAMKIKPCKKCGEAKYEEIQVGDPKKHKYYGKLYSITCKCGVFMTPVKSELETLWNK